ncbi:gp15 tail sheath stabilizer and completion protein [Acinetobacter phage Ac42]|uniref:gp15 tail sheath stabilizer and completion protein n=1 Tax=Acinetobacter phage Ac42 TaxID=762660 RepID=UPI0001EBCDA8|nr:gp15 tail sheath stabilizer and completion protein [Acinetobacter phage Ac42]ADI96412.1 gp15 tail sheath stabilizer and completion protein [Acinetobacter phage Ac42]
MHGGFYNSSFRRYIVMMGDLFSRTMVERRRDDKSYWQTVPITYGSKEHFVQKLTSKINSINSDLDIAKVETILPRMNLHLVDIMYQPDVKTNMLNRKLIQNPGNSSQMVSLYNPTPVKMIFELGIYTRHQNDMYQIVEQIIPYFQPHFVVKMKEISGGEAPIEIERDINVVWSTTSIDENMDAGTDTRRRIEWSFIFEVTGYIYPPVAEIKGEIRTVYLDFFANEQSASEAVFESFDLAVDPVEIPINDWEALNKPTVESMTINTRIPDPPGGVR